MQFDFSLNSIRDNIKKRKQQESQEEYRRIRTGMSMQAVSSNALNKLGAAANTQAANVAATMPTPKGTTTQTVQ